MRNIYLTIFIIGLVLIFILSNDKKAAYVLISLFGLIGFFVEKIFDRLDSKSVDSDES